MGLDVYVGSLTRYHSGQWETIVQRVGREEGMKVTMERQHDPPDAITNPEEIREVVLAWRAQLASELRSQAQITLDWGEGLDKPYFTDKPAWDCYAALLLWAAYEEHPDAPRSAIAPDDWTTDAAFRRSTKTHFQSRYSQLLYDIEMWLPAEFSVTFRAPGVAGVEIGIGSSPTLLAQLDELNRRTWCADERTLADWRREGADYGAPLETSARFGFSIMHSLGSASVANGLPMLLDY